MNLFFFQLWNELKKMFARKRTYIGFGAFFVMECLMLLSFNMPGTRRHMRQMIEANGYAFNEYFSGLTVAFDIVSFTTVLFGGLYLALVAGDLVAKEVEDGTLRMTLCRPVARSRLIIIKYISCVIYTFALILFIAVTALLAGLAYRGWGGMFIYAPLERIVALHSASDGFHRYLQSVPLLALSLTTISSLAFMLSCFNMKPAAATITTLSVIFLDFIFRNIPYFESLQPYFITTHIAAWVQTYVDYPPWWSVMEDYAYLIALDATLLVVALAVFQRRDFKA